MQSLEKIVNEIPMLLAMLIVVSLLPHKIKRLLKCKIRCLRLIRLGFQKSNFCSGSWLRLKDEILNYRACSYSAFKKPLT